MAFILSILAVLIILIFSELWWRKRITYSEFTRKSVHITVGSFVATWPFYLPWWQIVALSAAFLIGIGVSLKLQIFQAIHSVQRPTWGEIFFALAVGVCVFITEDKWIYAAALLQMSLADGMAAVVGTRFGRRQQYLMFGHVKSVAGTITFWIVSFAILLAYSYISPHTLGLEWMLAISALATAIENVAVRGLDNLLVPVLVALLLMHV